MPILSNYWFEDSDFRGNTTFFSIRHGAGSWANITWSNFTNKRSTLVWEREDREVLINLNSQVDTPAIRAIIDGVLGADARRTSGISAGWIPWRYVPYFAPRPDRGNLDLLVKMSFNFHIDTPGYCSDADGQINYYIRFFLTSAGNLRAVVDGWSYQYDGGLLICRGAINDRLNAAVPAGMATVQAQLDRVLALFGAFRFDLVYLLPGEGNTSGTGTVDVNRSCSLALLPRP